MYIYIYILSRDAVAYLVVAQPNSANQSGTPY